MPEFLAPGVYIEERPSGQSAIPGVSTSNFAVVGWTPRGAANQATLVTSLDTFFELFGGYTKYSDLALAVTAFFSNDGKRAYVTRVVPDDAVKATYTVVGLWKFDAVSEGAWGNLVRVSIQGSGNYYNVATATYSKFDVFIEEESADGDGDFNVLEQYEALVLDDVDHKDYIVSVLNDVSQRVDVTDLATGGIPLSLQSTSVSGEAVGTGTGSQTLFTDTLTQLEVAPGTLAIQVSGVTVATDDGEGAIVGVGVSGSINYETGALSVTFVVAPVLSAAITANYYQAGAGSVSYELAGGSDGTPESIDRSNISDPALVADSKGIYAMNTVEESFQLAVPDFSDDSTVSLDLLTYAEGRKDVFVILDVPANYTAQQALKYKRQTLGSLSNYGAIYYPKITIADPLKDGRPRNIASVGHVAGVYARTDNNKSVGKAPAGTEDGRLNFALGLERVVPKGEQELLYPANINSLWQSTATGRVVWGSRTLQVVGDFTQINARRLFIFLEKSIFNSTHNVVFENVGPALWATIKLRVEGFFFAQFTDGLFKGTTPDQAYRIVCDETNNPPAIQNARMVIVDYFVAVNEPGEFIRHRFQRKFD